MLKRYHFKATFYPTLASPSLYNEMDKWKNLATEGHELGNHTVYHPCQKSKIGMEWVRFMCKRKVKIILLHILSEIGKAI